MCKVLIIVFILWNPMCLALLAPAPPNNPTTAPASQPAMKLSLKAVSPEQIDASWTPIKGAIEYRIELSHDGKDFFDSATLDASEPRCSNSDLDPDKEHYFRVTALGPNERVLAVSNIASARTPAAPPPKGPIRGPATTSKSTS